jgi:hypothetical protein
LSGISDTGKAHAQKFGVVRRQLAAAAGGEVVGATTSKRARIEHQQVLDGD